MQDDQILLENQAPKVKSVFKNTNFVLLFMGALVSNLGSVFYNIAISYYILEVSNAVVAGLYLATGGLVFFIISPFGGAIVDRLDKAKVLYVTDYIRGLAIILAGYLLYVGLTNTQQIIMLFICTVILSINGAIFQPAASSLPAHILETEQLQQGNSAIQASESSYSIVGIMLGALIYGLVGIKIIFIINGVSYILSGISEMFIKTKQESQKLHQMTFKETVEDIKIGYRYLSGFKAVFYLILFASFLNFFVNPFFANGMPYLFKQQLAVESIYYSYVMAAFPAGIVLCSIVLGSIKQKEKIFGIMSKGLIMFSVILLLMAVNINLHLQNMTTFTVFMIASVALAVIMGVFNGMINIPFMTAIRVQIRKDMQGRVFSVLSVIAGGLTPISLGIAGVIIGVFGVMTLFYICGIGVLVLSLMLISNKHVRTL